MRGVRDECRKGEVDTAKRRGDGVGAYPGFRSETWGTHCQRWTRIARAAIEMSSEEDAIVALPLRTS